MKLSEGGPWDGVGGASTGTLGIPSTPGSNSQTFAQMADQGPNTLPASGFPFRTRTAERVWLFAQFLVRENPLLEPPEIVRQAILQSQQSVEDLTPEDMRLLLMAVEWLQNGPVRSTVRTAGGPTRSDFSKLSMESKLQEFVGGGSFPGPEPGKIGPVNFSSPNPFDIARQNELEKKRFKDKFKKKRKAIYQLAQWLKLNR